MRIFITGATGLIGRAVTDALIHRMDHVVAITRNEINARTVLNGSVEIHKADPKVPGKWQELIKDCDAVINLAGESVNNGLWTKKKKREIRESRLFTTRNLANAIKESEKVKTFISASSVAYYGSGDRSPLFEEHQSGGGFLSRVAYEWESCANDASNARVVPLRISMVLSKNGGAISKLALPYKFYMGGPIGNGKQYVPWIHIDDLVAIILEVLDNDIYDGPVNATAPDPPTMNEFADAMSVAMNKPAKFRAPAGLVKMLMGEKSDLVLDSYRAVPKKLRSHEFHFQYVPIQAGLDEVLG
jgi:uncharacterized protein